MPYRLNAELHRIITKIPISLRKGNIRRWHYPTVVKGCFKDDLALLPSPEDALDLLMIEITVLGTKKGQVDL